MMAGQLALVAVAAFSGATLAMDVTEGRSRSLAGGNGSSASPVYELRFARRD